MTYDFPEHHKDLTLEELGISVLNENDEIPLNEKPIPVGTEKEFRDDLLAKYIKDVNQFELLTPDEEKLLAQTVRNGDREASEEARQKLITGNLRLVIKIARDYNKFRTWNLTDLIQDGNIGLIHAVKKFDPEMGTKFSYYSSFWIKAYILKFIMDNWRLVKLGTTQAQRKLFYNLKREKEKLSAEGFEVSPQLLAEVMGVTEQDVTEMEQRLRSRDLSLEAPVKYDSEESHKDFLPDAALSPEELISRADLLAWLRENLDKFRKALNIKEKDILDLRLLSDSPMTLEKIGSCHKVSRERIRQIEARLIKKLEKFLEEVKLMKKGEGLRGIFYQPTAEKLQDAGIQTVTDLVSLTSDQLVEKFKNKKKHAATVRAIARGLLKKNLYFADGEEATQSLENYASKTYKPPAKTPASPPPPQAPSREAGADPLAIQLAASEASPDTPVSKNSLRATLMRFSAAFDFLTVNGGSPDKIEGYLEGFMAENEQEYILSISITRKNPPA